MITRINEQTSDKSEFKNDNRKEKSERILCHEQRAQLCVGHEDTVHEDKIIHCRI